MLSFKPASIAIALAAILGVSAVNAYDASCERAENEAGFPSSWGRASGSPNVYDADCQKAINALPSTGNARCVQADNNGTGTKIGTHGICTLRCYGHGVSSVSYKTLKDALTCELKTYPNYLCAGGYTAPNFDVTMTYNGGDCAVLCNKYGC